MDLGGFNWALMTILGPIILGAVVLWSLMRNRKSSKQDIDRTEQATHDLYRAEDAAHAREDDRVP
jgi:hypothetical protein